MDVIIVRQREWEENCQWVKVSPTNSADSPIPEGFSEIPGPEPEFFVRESEIRLLNNFE